MINTSDKMVSVFMLAYNHEKYIAEAIESVLMQKTDFDFDIVIGEDCSTDATRHIVLEYAQKYPNKIKPILHNVNVGAMLNQMYVLEACTGKYVAMCEGDDYWTDPFKLQKQVDFLEANKEYVLTTHGYRIVKYDSDPHTIDHSEFIGNNNTDGFEFDKDFTLYHWVTQPVTALFRRSAFKVDIRQYCYFRDVHLFYHILKNGKGYFQNFVGADYRLHNTGIDSTVEGIERRWLEYKIYRDLLNGSRNDDSLKKRFIRQQSDYLTLICDETRQHSKHNTLHTKEFIFDSLKYCGIIKFAVVMKKILLSYLTRNK